MRDLLKALDKISISNLANLEERLDGKYVLVETLKSNGDVEFDEVKIDLDSIYMKSAIRQKSYGQKFKDYQLVLGLNADEAKLQRLNYEKFLFQPSDFFEVVTDYLHHSKSDIYRTLDKFIEENFSNEKLILHTLNVRLLAKLKECHLELLNHFNFQTDSYTISNLDKTNSEPKLSEILLNVLDFLENLIKDLQLKYKFYYDESYFQTDFDLFLKKELEEFNSPKETTQSEDKKDYLWFKVGLVFATGEVFQLYEEEGGNFTNLAKRISKSKYKSYRPYISESWNNSTPSDKNIFSNSKKIDAIIKFCHKKGIKISDSFLSRCPSEDI